MVGKKVAPAPLAVKKEAPKKVVNPLFEKKARNYGIGINYFFILYLNSNIIHMCLVSLNRPRHPTQEGLEPICEVAQVC